MADPGGLDGLEGFEDTEHIEELLRRDLRPPARRPRSHPRVLIVLGVLLLAIGLVAVFLHYEPPLPNADFSHDGWIPADAEIARQREADAKLLAALEPGGAAYDELVRAFEEYNLEEVRSGGKVVDEGVRRAHTRIEDAVQRFVSVHGVERYRAVGLLVRKRFREALAGTIQAARAAGETTAFGERHEDEPVVAEARRLLGTFLKEARRTEVVSEDGTFARGGDLIVDLLFMYRWVLWAREVHPPEVMLSRFEWRTILAWKAWAHPELDAARRREVLGKLRALDPSFPAHRVMALHYEREGDIAAAARETVLALLDQPDDRTLLANLHLLTDPLEQRR